jgi:hypothetical protein
MSTQRRNLVVGPVAPIGLIGLLIVISVAGALSVWLWHYEAGPSTYNRASGVVSMIANAGNARTGLFDIGAQCTSPTLARPGSWSPCGWPAKP